jgi:hypothetical protein
MDSTILDVALLRGSMLSITIKGDITEDNLSTLRADVTRGAGIIREESEKALRPLPALVDVSGLNRTYSAEAIELLAEFEKNNRPYITHTAVFGADIKIKFTGEIVSAISGRKNISFYNSKEEALASLASDVTPAAE